MPIYTFFVEKQGATAVEQVEAPDLAAAVAGWHERSETSPGPLDPDEDLTPLKDRRNVWCFTGFDPEEAFYLVHVVGPLAE